MLRDNATIGPGLVGDGFVLDGTGDFVEVPHDPALNVGTGDFTVDLWVWFNTTDGEQVLVEKYIENFIEAPPGWFLTKLEDNSLRFGTGPGPLIANSAPLVLPTNTWIHVAARRAAGVASIFVNGIQVATGPFSHDADSNSSLKFGHRGNPNDTPTSLDTRDFFLNGRIDEVELLVGRALSNSEIRAIVKARRGGKCKQNIVPIDVKPGSFPNSINPESRALIPVAVLTSKTFDATTVDPTTVLFGATRTRAAPVRSALEDVDKDGDTDMVLYFRTKHTGIHCGDTLAFLTGKTVGGHAINGSDSIRTVGCKGANSSGKEHRSHHDEERGDDRHDRALP